MNGYKDVLEYHHAIKNDPNLVRLGLDTPHLRGLMQGIPPAQITEGEQCVSSPEPKLRPALQALDVRDSAHFRNPKTRPLADKLGLLLELIFKCGHPAPVNC